MSQESENVSPTVVDIQIDHKGIIPKSIADRNYELWRRKDIKRIALETLPDQCEKPQAEVWIDK